MKKKMVKYFLLILMLVINLALYANTNNDLISKEIKKVEGNLDVRVGVSVYNTEDETTWNYNGDVRFPLMSTFKTLASAKILYDVDHKTQSLEKNINITQGEILSYAPVTKNFVGKKFTLKDACSASMLTSDNTAANIMLESIGGPQELTKFLRSIGDNVTRLDRYEPTLNEALDGEIRDTTTPNAIVKTLNELLFGDTLSNKSKELLKKWRVDNKVSDSLLRSVLPEEVSIADRSGAGGYGSRGITAAVWSESYPPVIISIYLTQTEASFDSRNKAIAQIGEAIFKEYLK